MQKNEGIILITYPSRENDLVVKILTLNQGKLSLYARSAMKSKKRFPSLDLFQHISVNYEQERSSLFSLKESKTINSYHGLREDLTKLVSASLLCEVLEKITPEDSPESETIFMILKSAFEEFEESNDTKQTLRICYEKLYLILIFSGLIDNEPSEASAKKLFQLIQIVEEQIQSKIKTKEAIQDIIVSLKN